MIRFFRKIRQKLLSENKFTKYLAYALGEIALVVIGILIALQINTWNQYRKDRLEEKDILERIITNLDADLNHIETRSKWTNGSKLDMEILIKGILEKDLTHEKFTEHNRSLFGMMILEKTKSAYQEAISSGKIGLIVNDSLRDQIFRYYEINEVGADVFLQEYIANYFAPFFMKNFGHTREYVMVATNLPNTLESVDLNKVYNNKEYLAVLSSKLALLTNQIAQWSNEKRKIHALKAMINKELAEKWENTLSSR